MYSERGIKSGSPDCGTFFGAAVMDDAPLSNVNQVTVLRELMPAGSLARHHKDVVATRRKLSCGRRSMIILKFRIASINGSRRVFIHRTESAPCGTPERPGAAWRLPDKRRGKT